MAAKIESSSTAEYFAKNLQQVGFSSPTKAVLTTLKEAVDNSLDACEFAGIKPELTIQVDRVGKGSQKNTDLVSIIVEDNGPGIEPDDMAKVFGEYLASSKFGKGQCSRGQQGIGISAATTWAQLTSASGVQVTSKTKAMRKAIKASIDVDIKKNKGIVREKDTIEWEKPHGVRVEFKMDGRIQLNGEGGLLTYMEGTTLVNPHLNLKYKLLDQDWVDSPAVTDSVPEIPSPVNPHPHTLKLGEFITHAHLYGGVSLSKWLKTAFSRVTDQTISDFVKNGLKKNLLNSGVNKLNDSDFKMIFQAIQDTDLMAPSTRSVLTVGEEAMSKSIQKLGQVDFFSILTRKPKICDAKPVVVEIALARFLNRGTEEESVQVLRFANRVPLQFDKAACAITKAIESVNWRAYGLNQPKNSVPYGPYIFAVSVVSPFIKFKNASKETIDASDELVEELRLALMQAGQKLSRHIRAEARAEDLERKIRHIEQFGPILVEGLVRITKANKERKIKAEEGLKKLLGRDANAAEKDMAEATTKLEQLKAKQALKFGESELAAAEESTGVAGEQMDLLAVDSEQTKQGSIKSSTKKLAGTVKSTAKKTATKKEKSK